MEGINEIRKQKIGLITKAFSGGFIDKDTFLKAFRDISHLVPKKVQVRGKDGKMYQSIRWVDPNTNEPVKLIDRQFKVEVAGGDIEQKVLDISTNSSISKADKIRMMINEGIYDSPLLSLFSGAPISDINYYSKLDAGIDIKEMSARSEQLKDAVRKEQQNNDTPSAKEENDLLTSTLTMDEIWAEYAMNLTRVAKGRHKFAIGYGSGGVGKTFTFEEIAEKLELREYDYEVQPSADQYDYVIIKGRISPIQVYAEMYRHKDKLIVFDDCDSFLATLDVQGFLKGGLDTGKNNKIDNKTGRNAYIIEGDKESGRIPDTFRFKGRVIAITNLSLNDIDGAVVSRAMASNLTMTAQQTVDKMKNIGSSLKVFNADKSEVLDVSDEAKELSINYLEIYKDYLKDKLNMRTFSNLTLKIQDYIDAGMTPENIARHAKHYVVKDLLDAVKNEEKLYGINRAKK
jgi:hypothetical protein